MQFVFLVVDGALSFAVKGDGCFVCLFPKLSCLTRQVAFNGYTSAIHVLSLLGELSCPKHSFLVNLSLSESPADILVLGHLKLNFIACIYFISGFLFRSCHITAVRGLWMSTCLLFIMKMKMALWNVCKLECEISCCILKFSNKGFMFYLFGCLFTEEITNFFFFFF